MDLAPPPSRRATLPVIERVQVARWDRGLIGAAAKAVQWQRGNGRPDDADVLGLAARAGVVDVARVARERGVEAALDTLAVKDSASAVLLVVALHPLDDARCRTVAVDLGQPYRLVLQVAVRRGLSLLIDKHGA